MKYLFVVFLLQWFANSTFEQMAKPGDKFVFKGKVKGQDTGALRLGYIGVDGKYHLDSCSLTNGFFEFHGQLNEPRIASFYGNRKSRSVDDPNFTDIFLEPGTITGAFRVDNFKQGEVFGSRSHDELQIYNNRYASLQRTWKSTWNRLQTAKEHKDEETVDRINNNELVGYYIESDKLVYTFIREFPKSYVSAYFLIAQTHKLSIDSLRLFYNLLDLAVQESSYGKAITSFISKAERLLVGNILPNFTLPDIN